MRCAVVGEIQSASRPEAIARTLFFIYSSSARRWIRSANPTWRRGLAEFAEVFDVVLRGCCTARAVPVRRAGGQAATKLRAIRSRGPHDRNPKPKEPPRNSARTARTQARRLASTIIIIATRSRTAFSGSIRKASFRGAGSALCRLQASRASWCTGSKAASLTPSPATGANTRRGRSSNVELEAMLAGANEYCHAVFTAQRHHVRVDGRRRHRRAAARDGQNIVSSADLVSEF